MASNPIAYIPKVSNFHEFDAHDEIPQKPLDLAKIHDDCVISCPLWSALKSSVRLALYLKAVELFCKYCLSFFLVSTEISWRDVVYLMLALLHFCCSGCHSQNQSARVDSVRLVFRPARCIDLCFAGPSELMDMGVFMVGIWTIMGDFMDKSAPCSMPTALRSRQSG